MYKCLDTTALLLLFAEDLVKNWFGRDTSRDRLFVVGYRRIYRTHHVRKRDSQDPYPYYRNPCRFTGVWQCPDGHGHGPGTSQERGRIYLQSSRREKWGRTWTQGPGSRHVYDFGVNLHGTSSRPVGRESHRARRFIISSISANLSIA